MLPNGSNKIGSPVCQDFEMNVSKEETSLRRQTASSVASRKTVIHKAKALASHDALALCQMERTTYQRGATVSDVQQKSILFSSLFKLHSGW